MTTDHICCVPARVIPPQRSLSIRRITGGVCECCGGALPPHLLELHGIPAGKSGTTEEPGDSLLVLCPMCHRDFHERGVGIDIQRLLAGARSPAIRRRIGKVLCLKHPYIPPESPDPAELFSAAVGSGGTDLFLNGA